MKKQIVVLLTVYNRLTVKNTIESILEQTFKDFELLIIDNASDDGTYELLMTYAGKDSRVTVVRNEKNMGQTYSLLRGMEIADAKYIARIDADDLMHKDRLKKQYEFLELNPDYGLCGSWVQFITDDDRLAMVIKMPTTDDGLRAAQRISCSVYHPAVMMRKSLLDKYSIKYDSSLKMAEDYDMWRQILMHSKGLNLPEVLLYYRRGDNNDSVSNKDITLNEDVLVRRKVCFKEEYPGKSYMSVLLDIENSDKKSLITTIRAFFLYKKFLNVNLDRCDADYKIINNRIRSRMIGQYLLNNSAHWSHFLYWIYLKIRKARYSFAK